MASEYRPLSRRKPNEDPVQSSCYRLCTRTGSNEQQKKGLKYCNFVATLVHSANAIAILALILTKLSEQNFVPVTINKLDGRPGEGNYTKCEEIYKINPQWLSFVFAVICALFHFGYFYHDTRKLYEERIDNLNNWYRWVEYSLSASIMIVQISLLTGITDQIALLNAFGCVFGMIWFGQFVEVAVDRNARIVAFVLGSILGMFPWAGILTTYGLSADDAPWFVHVIVVGQFVTFMGFAVVALRHLIYIDSIKDKQDKVSFYIRGELIYNILSLFAKTYLLWFTYAANA